MKYKVGDKVRIKRDLEEGYGYRFGVNDEMEKLKGQIVTIARVDNDSYKIKEDKEVWYWSEDMFEGLVEFKKSDLKDGDVVTYRDGRRRIVTDNAKRLRGINDVGYSLTIDFTEDLRKENGNTECDIIRVERPTQYVEVFKIEDKREMTIAEIEKELGYSIKLIKEREE